MSQAVVHGGIVYLAGQVGSPDTSVAEQTGSILAKIDELLIRAGSDRNSLLSATVWLGDMADFVEMNSVWDEWIRDYRAPARATGEVKLASPGYKVEIIVVAAVG